MKKVIKKEDFVGWIQGQPDERPVDMSQNAWHDECGCLMVQYVRDNNLLSDTEYRCGYWGWIGRNGYAAAFDHNSFSIEPWLDNDVKNFGDAKKLIE